MNRFLLVISLTIIIPTYLFSQPETEDSYGTILKNSMIWHKPGQYMLNEPHSAGFRKRIDLKKIPSKAEMMLFADSRYLLWINGKYVERGPCRFDPKGPQYDVINIRNYLIRGMNTIAIMVQGNVTGSLKIMKHTPGLTAILKTDNRQFVTDTTWLCSERIPEQMITDIWTWSCILDSIDANSPDYNWQKPQFDDSRWNPVRRATGEGWGPLTRRTLPLLKETDLGNGTLLQVKNMSLIDTAHKKLAKNLPLKFRAGDEIIIDAGKLSLTYWTIDIDAEKGTGLLFSPCQDFVNGETIINYNCVTSYTAREGKQKYMSNETFGFRYLNIKVLSGSATLNNIRFTSRLYPDIKLAAFECSDDFLNKAWLQTSYTAEVLCEDGYVDSAERAEWMADAAMIQYPVSRMVISGPGGGTNKTLYSDPRLMHNMLIHMAQSQQDDGRLKAHHPSDRFDLHWYIEDYSCLWVQGLRQYYDNTSDLKFVKDQWPVLQKQMKWFFERKNGSGLYTAREFLIHLDNPLRYQVCQGATLNAFIYKALVDASYLAAEVGLNSESAIYKQSADSLKSAYNNLMWDKQSGSFFAALFYPEMSKDEPLPELKLVEIEDPASQSFVWNDGNVQWIEKGEKVPTTVQAALVALNRGIVSDEHMNETRNYLLTHAPDLRNPYTHLMLFDELYKYDKDSLDVAILNIIRTRWKSMVSRVSPGTSAEGFETQGYLCHPFGLIPAYSLPAYVLGVRKPEPVTNKIILLEPRLGDLSFAKGIALTEFGPVPLEWKRVDANTLKFRFEIPENIEAVVRLPAQDDKNLVILNGKPVQFTTAGRFLEFRVKQGKYAGSVRKIK